MHVMPPNHETSASFGTVSNSTYENYLGSPSECDATKAVLNRPPNVTQTRLPLNRPPNVTQIMGKQGCRPYCFLEYIFLKKHPTVPNDAHQCICHDYSTDNATIVQPRMLCIVSPKMHLTTTTCSHNLDA